MRTGDDTSRKCAPAGLRRLGLILTLSILFHGGALWAAQRLLGWLPRPAVSSRIDVQLMDLPVPAPVEAPAPAEPPSPPPPVLEPPPPAPAERPPVVAVAPLAPPSEPIEVQPVSAVREVVAVTTESPPPRPTLPEPVVIATVEPQAERTPPRFGAAYLHNPPPAYPESARREGRSGQVLLRVAVGVDGRPVRVAVASGSGSASLDGAALRAVRRWTFEPAREGSAPVAAEVEVPIRFSLR